MIFQAVGRALIALFCFRTRGPYGAQGVKRTSNKRYAGRGTDILLPLSRLFDLRRRNFRKIQQVQEETASDTINGIPDFATLLRKRTTCCFDGSVFGAVGEPGHISAPSLEGWRSAGRSRSRGRGSESPALAPALAPAMSPLQMGTARRGGEG